MKEIWISFFVFCYLYSVQNGTKLCCPTVDIFSFYFAIACNFIIGNGTISLNVAEKNRVIKSLFFFFYFFLKMDFYVQSKLSLFTINIICQASNSFLYKKKEKKDQFICTTSKATSSHNKWMKAYVHCICARMGEGGEGRM